MNMSNTDWSVGYKLNAADRMHACNCIGPQPGEKLCPCMLRGENERKRQMLHEGIVIDGQPYRLVLAKPEPTA